MAPNHDPNPPVDPNKVQEDDLVEMEAVDERLDALSCALDVFEQRTDDILSQLRELLDSNREIRRQIEDEKKLQEENLSKDDDDDDSAMDEQ